MQVRHPKLEIAPQQLFPDLAKDSCRGAVNCRNCLRIQDEPLCRFRQPIHNPPDPIPHIINVEKKQAALDEIYGKPRDCLGAWLTMQLVETTLARNAAKQAIAWTRYAGQEI
jgi:hypothetical protein